MAKRNISKRVEDIENKQINTGKTQKLRKGGWAYSANLFIKFKQAINSLIKRSQSSKYSKGCF